METVVYKSCLHWLGMNSALGKDFSKYNSLPWPTQQQPLEKQKQAYLFFSIQWAFSYHVVTVMIFSICTVRIKEKLCFIIKHSISSSAMQIPNKFKKEVESSSHLTYPLGLQQTLSIYKKHLLQRTLIHLGTWTFNIQASNGTKDNYSISSDNYSTCSINNKAWKKEVL